MIAYIIALLRHIEQLSTRLRFTEQLVNELSTELDRVDRLADCYTPNQTASRLVIGPDPRD